MMAAFEQAWSIWEEEEGKGREGIWRFLERRWTWHPRSPSPKMRPPSVTTIASTFFSGQFFRQSKICPLQRILFCQSLVVKRKSSIYNGNGKMSTKTHLLASSWRCKIKECLCVWIAGWVGVQWMPHTCHSGLWRDHQSDERSPHIPHTHHPRLVYKQLAKAPPHSRSAPCRTVSRSFPAIPRQSFPSIPLGSKADTQILRTTDRDRNTDTELQSSSVILQG